MSAVTSTPDTGPDSIWVFLIIIGILAVIVLLERRREARRRARRFPGSIGHWWDGVRGVPIDCEVIGCHRPHGPTRWLETHGVWACAPCADKLGKLYRQLGGVA